MIISVTERGSYKRCRRQWQLTSSNREGLTNIVPAAALGLGTLIHTALADWLEHPDLKLREIFLLRANMAIEHAKEVYLEQVGAKISEFELGSLYDAVNLGSAMMQNYQDHWKTPLPPGFDLVAPEQRVQIPIPGTEHYLEGRLDAIIREVSGRRRLYVLEHKTYSKRPTATDLRWNDQFISYHWMLEQLDLGEVAGVAYDGMWKRNEPPKKVDNRVGAVADLFCRTRLERSPAELEEHARMLALEANEMASNPAIYTNRTWDGSCDWGCNVNKLCFAMSAGDDVDLLKARLYTLKHKLGVTEDE